MKNIYLDNNATTMVAPEVVEAMKPFFEDLWGNPSSMHTFGGQTKKHIERARRQVASLIGAEPDEIVFTSCGTESNNMAVRGAVEAHDEHSHIVTTRIEHPTVLSVCRHLANHGCTLTEVGVDSQGQLALDELKDAITRDTAIVSIMWANNETGMIFPIDRIAGIVKKAGCLLHTDAVQAVGKVPIDVRKTLVDMLSLSGHKLHAPKGIGALYIRKGTRVNPLLLGGHQERGKRAGTENVPYIVGLGRACELAAEQMEEGMVRVKALRDRLEAGILQTCRDVTVNGDRQHCLPNTLDVGFKCIDGGSVLLMLDDLGIAASSGSACTSGSLGPSHVLRAMGVPLTSVHGFVRFSLSRYSTDEDIDYVLEHIPRIVERLLAISPFAQKPAQCDRHELPGKMKRDSNKIAGTAGKTAQAVRPVQVHRVSGSSVNQETLSDTVAVERAVTVMVEEVGSFTVMCTPSDVKALAVGFIYSEGMIESVEDIIGISTAKEDVIGIRINDPAGATGKRNMIIASSCGMCGVRTIQKALSDMSACGNSLRIAPRLLIDIMEQLRPAQQVFQLTGGSHAAGVFSPDGKLMDSGEDIGRHSALDKAIGKCLLAGRAMAGCGVVLSGRVSYEMVAKAARPGIELIVAVSAPTSMAIDAAERWNITLCGFVRAGRANVYTHPERIDDS